MRYILTTEPNVTCCWIGYEVERKEGESRMPHRLLALKWWSQSRGWGTLTEVGRQIKRGDRSKVKRQIILHLENKNVVILQPPHGMDASVRTQFASAVGKKSRKTTD